MCRPPVVSVSLPWATGGCALAGIWNRYGSLLAVLSDFLGGDAAAGDAVFQVESSGRRFEDFASSYNGSGQAAVYGERISKSFAVCKSLTA